MRKILNVIIVLLIILFGYFCYFKYVLKVDYTGFGPYKIVTISSDSMKPFINNGDAVFIKKKSEYKKNDIICYQSYSVLNIRSITEINGDKITVRENYTGNEDTVLKKDIVGIKKYTLPHLGNLLHLLVEPWVLLFVCILMGSYFAFGYSKK